MILLRPREFVASGYQRPLHSQAQQCHLPRRPAGALPRLFDDSADQGCGLAAAETGANRHLCPCKSLSLSPIFDGFQALHTAPGLEELNVRAPSALSFKALGDDALFLVTLKAPRNFALSAAFFPTQPTCRFPCRLLWPGPHPERRMVPRAPMKYRRRLRDLASASARKSRPSLKNRRHACERHSHEIRGPAASIYRPGTTALAWRNQCVFR